MCLVIDTNVLSCVFEVKNSKHNDFAPVLEWVLNGKGKIIYGGSTYISEIGKKYLSIFTQLKTAGLAKKLNKNDVDTKEEEVRKTIIDDDFDDQHIVSILIISKCQIIVSCDKRAYPFFTHKIFFPKPANRPKIYSSSKNSDLLCDKHIADICLPTKKTTNSQWEILNQLADNMGYIKD